MTRSRPNQSALLALLIAGYLGVWVLFGVAVHVADLADHEVTERVTGLGANDWTIGAGTLIIAWAYQFTPLKYRCLDKCRSAFSFISSRWSGGNEMVQSFRLGLDHGLFCLGCCWSFRGAAGSARLWGWSSWHGDS